MRTPFPVLRIVAVVAVVSAIGAGRARADVPPPDSCTSPGQPCQNAGPQHDKAGTCASSTCTKQVPAPEGGTMPMTYDCNLCQAADAGAGAGGAAGGGGAGGAGGSTSTSSGSSGCAVAGGRERRDLAPTMILLAAGLVFTARRRRTSVG